MGSVSRGLAEHVHSNGIEHLLAGSASRRRNERSEWQDHSSSSNRRRKAKTINKYLGRNYTVKASYGHVMDLPKKTIGILLPGEENGKKKKAESARPKAKAAGKEGCESRSRSRRRISSSPPTK